MKKRAWHLEFRAELSFEAEEIERRRRAEEESLGLQNSKRLCVAKRFLASAEQKKAPAPIELKAPSSLPMAQGSLAALLRGDPAPKPTARERSRSPRRPEALPEPPEALPEAVPAPVPEPVESPKAWHPGRLSERPGGLQCGLQPGTCGLVARELHVRSLEFRGVESMPRCDSCQRQALLVANACIWDVLLVKGVVTSAETVEQDGLGL